MDAETRQGPPARRGGRRKGSGKRADASAPWALRAIQALSDGSRWTIVQYVSEREATVGSIARGLGLSMACTSKHLSILREADLIEIRREGREARCRLAAPQSRAGQLLRGLGIDDRSEPAPSSPGADRRNRNRTSPAPELETVPSFQIKRYQSNDIDDYLL